MNTPEKNNSEKHIDRMLEIIGNKPGVFHIQMQHDDDCPALKSHRMIDCRCEPDIKLMDAGIHKTTH